MGRDFSGQVAARYARHRRGYPSEVVDVIAHAFGLGPDDIVLDLGCGTGQLTIPLAARVHAVIGMDPEPDMLDHARAAAREHGTDNVSWMLGADRDLVRFPTMPGVPRRLAAMTVAVAIHWMDRDALFPAARRLLRPGGGIAIVTNGAPLWLQDAAWSRDLRAVLEAWTGRSQTGACQTDEAGRRLNQDALERAGFQVTESAVSYDAPLAVDDVIGGVLSALSGDGMPSAESQAEFAARVRSALAPHGPLTEHVTVWIQTGR
jgi:SAM-dependent methyltransferase